MKVLVVGGCGFVGSHVVDRCLAEGLSVRVLDRRPEPFRPPVEGVEYLLQDLTGSEPYDEALSGVDAVVHLASTSVPSTSNLDPASDISGNLLPAIRLLEAMRKQGTPRLVFFSSGGTVYGVPSKDPVPETHPLNPICSYGIVKAAIEQYLHMEHQLHGLSYVSLRPSNVYGARQGNTGIQGVIGTCLQKVLKNEPLEIWGDGQVVRDFLHVDDAVDLCYRALVSEATGTFNAGSGAGTSISEVLEIVGEVTGSKIEPVYRPGRRFDVPRIVLDSRRARAEFGWLPAVVLRQGIAGTWDWVRGQATHHDAMEKRGPCRGR